MIPLRSLLIPDKCSTLAEWECCTFISQISIAESSSALIHFNILTTSHLIYSEAASITTAYEAGFARVEAQPDTPMHTTHKLFVCSPFLPLHPSLPLSPSLCHGSENMSQSALQATHVQHVPACWCDFTASQQPCTVDVCVNIQQWLHRLCECSPCTLWHCVWIFQMEQPPMLPWTLVGMRCMTQCFQI